MFYCHKPFFKLIHCALGVDRTFSPTRTVRGEPVQIMPGLPRASHCLLFLIMRKPLPNHLHLLYLTSLAMMMRSSVFLNNSIIPSIRWSVHDQLRLKHVERNIDVFTYVFSFQYLSIISSNVVCSGAFSFQQQLPMSIRCWLRRTPPS